MYTFKLNYKFQGQVRILTLKANSLEEMMSVFEANFPGVTLLDYSIVKPAPVISFDTFKRTRKIEYVA
jgi:hypothetical protein